MSNPAKLLVATLAAIGAADLAQNGQPAPVNIAPINKPNDGTRIGNGMGSTHDMAHVVLEGKKIERKDDPEVSVQDMEERLQLLIGKGMDVTGVMLMMQEAADPTLVEALDVLVHQPPSSTSSRSDTIRNANLAMMESINQVARQRIMREMNGMLTRTAA